MFWNKYPYINLTDLNLDYILRILKMLSEAKNIDYDDENTGLNADNVQSAIEALHTLITNTSAYIRVDDIIPAVDWLNGKTFTHIQTVNNATLTAIMSAVKNEEVVVLAVPNGDDKSYYNLVAVDEDSLNLTHTLYFWSDIDNMMRSLVINGLNDAENVYIELLPAAVIKVEAINVNYDNTGSGMTATDVQSAIDELKGDIPTTASDIGYDNSGSGMTATDVQSAIDELKGDIPTTASDIGYDNSGSGMTATDVQDAIDELKGDIPSTASDISYDNSGSGLTATDVQDAIDEISGIISGALKYTGTHTFTFTYDGNTTAQSAWRTIYSNLLAYISAKSSNYRFKFAKLSLDSSAYSLGGAIPISANLYNKNFSGSIEFIGNGAGYGNYMTYGRIDASTVLVKFDFLTLTNSSVDSVTPSSGSESELNIDEYEIV